MNEKKHKIIKRDKVLQKDVAKTENVVIMQGESDLIAARRNLLSSLAFLNKSLGIECCERCGKKAA
jgi:hypothetical protein